MVDVNTILSVAALTLSVLAIVFEIVFFLAQMRTNSAMQQAAVEATQDGATAASKAYREWADASASFQGEMRELLGKITHGMTRTETHLEQQFEKTLAAALGDKAGAAIGHDAMQAALQPVLDGLNAVQDAIEKSGASQELVTQMESLREELSETMQGELAERVAAGVRDAVLSRNLSPGIPVSRARLDMRPTRGGTSGEIPMPPAAAAAAARGLSPEARRALLHLVSVVGPGTYVRGEDVLRRFGPAVRGELADSPLTMVDSDGDLWLDEAVHTPEITRTLAEP